MVANTNKLNTLLSQGYLMGNIKDVAEPSFTLNLGNKIYFYQEDIILDINDKNSIVTLEKTLDETGYILEPGEFILMNSLEKVKMPDNYLGYIVTRSALAKIGLQSHLCSPHIDPKADLHITFEIKNNSNNKIRIYPGMSFAKVYLFKVEN